MGCCGSKSDIKQRKTASGNVPLPSPVKGQRKVDAHKQRRRLSVAPHQVGDISKVQLSRRFSAVSESHIPTATQEPKKFVAISKKGYVPYNKNKVNQDSYFCDYNFDGCTNVRLFGVADGHGEYGHNVSTLVARKIPKYLKTYDYKTEPVKSIEATIARVVETLRKSNINTTFSGTTLVFSLIVDLNVYTANLGDSRAIIVSKVADETNPNNDSNNDNDEEKEQTLTINAKALSFDHKPDLPEEEERILQTGGRVAPLPGAVGEDPGPNRVWLADIDVPGLAMSRSLGDDVAHSVGVSNLPEITVHTIDELNDEFMMFASDGIWEFIANEEAATIVYQRLPDLRDAALKLVKEAISRWRDEEEVIDDITAVIFNLKQAAISDKKQKLAQEQKQKEEEENKLKQEQENNQIIEEEEEPSPPEYPQSEEAAAANNNQEKEEQEQENNVENVSNPSEKQNQNEEAAVAEADTKEEIET